VSTGAERLAGVLQQIVEHDTDYDLRYPLVFEALALALDLDMRAGIVLDPAEPDWPVVYIELPTGQISWHMPRHGRPWDGHTTEQKFERISAFAEDVRPEIAGLLGCPNTPPCTHPALVHDTDELNAPQPLCCTQGCTCGRPA
jgi:hypothetical protein